MLVRVGAIGLLFRPDSPTGLARVHIFRTRFPGRAVTYVPARVNYKEGTQARQSKTPLMCQKFDPFYPLDVKISVHSTIRPRLTVWFDKILSLIFPDAVRG